VAAPRGFGADLAAGASWPAARRELRAIDAPVAVIAGSRSAPARRDAARALADLLPNGELVEVEAGLLVHVEEPAAVAAAISKFGA
jgi:pimeloyl-ACP methyl ester carboxylesterase